MKKVLLIGDSIRKGYDKYVKHALKDTCDVFYPAENCMYTIHVYRRLHNWKDELMNGDNVDLIHFNAGLWDALELIGEEGSEGTVTPMEIYAFYMERICKRIKFLFPEAKVIFATSTPVREEMFNKSVAIRTNENIRKYNAVATEIVKKYGFEVNDLYAVAEKLPETVYSDCTHLYTPEGTCALTNAVVSAISNSLGIEYIEFNLDSYTEVTDILGI